MNLTDSICYSLDFKVISQVSLTIFPILSQLFNTKGDIEAKAAAFDILLTT